MNTPTLLSKYLPLILSLAFLLPTTQAQSLPQPDLALSSASALLMEPETGAILYEKDPHTPLAPASVTKIMTILLVMEALDQGQIDPQAPLSTSAYAASMGGSQVYLREGETLPLWDLLKCVVVSSANDASVVLAEYLAGSEASFVQQMNERAQELGMVNTHFVNCTGLPAEGHLTTAYDIALMSRQLLLHHPDVQELTTIWMDSIREGTFGLSNTNRLIRFYDGATGLKTGSTDQALYCMSASAQREGVSFLAVVLKAPTSDQRFADAQTLLDYAFATFTLVDVFPPDPLLPLPVLLGTEDFVQPLLGQSTKLLLAKSQVQSLETQAILAENVEAPVVQGQILGTLEIYVEDSLYQTIPIQAQSEVQRLSTLGIFSKLFAQLTMA